MKNLFFKLNKFSVFSLGLATVILVTFFVAVGLVYAAWVGPQQPPPAGNLPGFIFNNTTPQAGANFNISGTGIVGTLETGILKVGGSPNAGQVLTAVDATGLASWQNAVNYSAGTNIAINGNVISVIDSPVFAGNVAINGAELNHNPDNPFYINSNDALQLRINRNGGTGAFGLNNSADSRLFTILNSGNVGVGITNPDKKLYVVGQLAVDNDANLTNRGCLQYNGTTNKLQYSDNCTTFSDFSSGGGIGGSGTLNYVAKFTPNGTTLGNSQIFDNGASVGIGTSNPTKRIEIVDTDEQALRISEGSGGSVGRLEIGYNSANDYGRIQAWNPILSPQGRNLILQPGGGSILVGVTTGSSPTSKLYVRAGSSAEGAAIVGFNFNSDPVGVVGGTIGVYGNSENNISSHQKRAVVGIASGSNSGNAYGLYGDASGENAGADKYGVYAVASGTNGVKYGVYGRASGDGGTKYGIYGEALGSGGTKWAGYFVGNVYASNYIQFGNNNAGAPPAADCDNNAERGRLSIDRSNNRLYICNGAVRRWDYITLTD